jgi:hypothetical protein
MEVDIVGSESRGEAARRTAVPRACQEAFVVSKTNWLLAGLCGFQTAYLAILFWTEPD